MGAHCRCRAFRPALILCSPFLICWQMMSQVEGQQKSLVRAIEALPGSGPLTALDQDLLLLKATSAATLSCLGECLSLLQQSIHQVGQYSHRTGPSENPGWQGPKSHSTERVKNGAVGLPPSSHASVTWAALPAPTASRDVPSKSEPKGSASQEDRTNEEETDNEENGDENADNSEDHHSIVLHLISQLRFGMDLTKVALPTFILETRSLLEMFANFMAHPDLLLSIGSAATPEERAISFVEYYLTSFREGRKGSVAKKPYNPILGEIFHCSWDIPKDQVKPLLREQNEAEAPAPSTEPDREHSPRERYKLRFVAEQVSHHPPVSCFYCECKERGMFVNTHVWTKSKFMGMSVGVSLLGEGVLRLLDYEEDYIFTLPNAYARSILTIPWVELGGKVTMECAKTGYTALVTFHTKPFYGGKVHRVTAEVKHKPSNTVVCKAQGEWNGVLEFTYSNGETKLINTAALPVYPKKVRPIEKQEPMESRNLWREVTNSIKVGDMNSATEFKRNLEDKQRKEEQERASRKAEWRPRYFNKQVRGLERRPSAAVPAASPGQPRAVERPGLVRVPAPTGQVTEAEAEAGRPPGPATEGRAVRSCGPCSQEGGTPGGGARSCWVLTLSIQRHHPSLLLLSGRHPTCLASKSPEGGRQSALVFTSVSSGCDIQQALNACLLIAVN
ncbi:oxysterol-binding protein-related protein 10-like isoform 2-T2 [Sarcophilus harrisii]